MAKRNENENSEEYNTQIIDGVDTEPTDDDDTQDDEDSNNRVVVSRVALTTGPSLNPQITAATMMLPY